MSSEASATGPRRNVRIGKYEVLTHIASGGMGAVYKARDTEKNREVALKVLSPEMAAKPAMVERFRREARHAAKLRHENVVTLYEFGAANQTYFLAMEFVDGIDLHEYSNRKGALDPDEALDFIVQGCRALEHAHQCGVVHRDIKPSNFLVTRQNGRTVIKLTDLGLAREANNEEFRVTRAGTTVGTLDYMAPEQARDSGLADIRSDLYSLGSTWYHLLAATPPFPKGGLGERLNRILNEEPTDIRGLNPRVSEATAAVLRRMMAKEPSQRYQTPAELLRELDSLKRGEQPATVLQALTGSSPDDEETIATSRKKGRRSESGRRTPRPSSRGRARPDTESRRSTTITRSAGKQAARRHLWYGLAGAVVVLVLAGLLLVLSSHRRHRDETPPLETANADSSPTKQTSTIPPLASPIETVKGGTHPSLPASKGATAPKAKTKVPPSVKRASWPALYRPSTPLDAAPLRQEIEKPWTQTAAPTQTVELAVGRLPPDPSGKTFPSLRAAFAAVPQGAIGIIELRDNGPFFDVPAVADHRSLVIRPAKGYRPLLVWDVDRTLAERRHVQERNPSADLETPTFLNVKHGSLTLQGVHVALRWPDASSKGASVLRVSGGDLTVSDCTFSLIGKPRDSVSVARLTATMDDKKDCRCRFDRCYLRGAGMSVLDVNAPGAQVLFDNCLLVGGEAPLLRVRAGMDRPTHLRAVRSTMICRKNLLTVSPATGQDHVPALDWLGWDVFLSRASGGSGGELLRLSGDSDTRSIRWRAVNCLYAGWNTLLAGKKVIAGTDIAGWQRLWGRNEGDAVRSKSWPAAFFPEPAELPASTFRTAASSVAFAASTASDQLLGCDLERLPPLRNHWMALTFNRFPVLAPALPNNADPPPIPVPGDGMYHGERLDLSRIDLGTHLQTMRRIFRFAPRIVLHLSGSGECLTTPIRLKGVSLVLYFEPPINKSEPLVLVADVPRNPSEAVIDIEEGGLEIINGRFRFSAAAEKRRLPSWFIKVRGGDVRLFRTQLQVPPRDSSTRFGGLILLDGSGEENADSVHSCLVHESVLMSAEEGIRIQGIGARVVLAQTLMIAGRDALRLTLDPGFAGKANVQCLLEHATVAANASVLRLADVKYTQPPAEPVIVQTHDCAFLNLFGRAARPGLLRYDGEALARGLLVWQSENDSFDRRLWFGAASASAPAPNKIVDRASWMALWGPSGPYRSKYELPFLRALDAKTWSLELLALRKPQLPGANLEKLDLVRKPKTDVPR